MTATLTQPRVHQQSDYGMVLAQVQEAHLLDRSARIYFPRLAGLAAMVAVGVGAFVWVGQSWWQIGVAAYFAVVFAQLGFLGHDAGHQQIFRSKRWNDRFGVMLSNLGVGLSYGWWVEKHGAHHRHPNEVGRDPDVQRNVFAWTPEQAASQRGPLRFVARHQAAFFFPLLVFEAWNLHVGSVRVLFAAPRRRLGEIAMLAIHATVCLALLLLVLSPVKALVFLAVQQSLFGLYLGSSFAPNHKGMLIPDRDDELDFFRRQVLTSRNVSGGRAMAAVFGGLNYQIEHHLFPSMPSRNLRRCRPLVKAYCAENDVAYCETSLIRSYAQALRHLRRVRPLRS